MKARAEGWSFGYNHHLIEHSYGLSQGILRQRKKSLPPIKPSPRRGKTKWWLKDLFCLEHMCSHGPLHTHGHTEET